MAASSGQSPVGSQKKCKKKSRKDHARTIKVNQNMFSECQIQKWPFLFDWEALAFSSCWHHVALSTLEQNDKVAQDKKTTKTKTCFEKTKEKHIMRIQKIRFHSLGETSIPLRPQDMRKERPPPLRQKI